MPSEMVSAGLFRSNQNGANAPLGSVSRLAPLGMLPSGRFGSRLIWYSTVATEMAFPSFEHLERFSARTMSALGALWRLHCASNTAWSPWRNFIRYAQKFSLFCQQLQLNQNHCRSADAAYSLLAKETGGFFLQLSIVDTEVMVSGCLSPRTRWRACTQFSIRAKASAWRP